MPPGVKEAQVSNGVFIFAFPFGEVKQMKTPVEIDVLSDGKQVSGIKTTFIGPVYKQHQQEQEESKEEEKASTEHHD